jgi:hypothetical protein
MDYAALRQTLIDNGFAKLNTSVDMLTKFVTEFSGHGRTIRISWELGGHISSISESNKFYSSVEEFLETI